MSRAFTKEIDDAPPPALPDRPIGTPPFLVTPRGAELIEAKVAELDEAIEQANDPSATEALAREQRYWVARHAGMEIVPPVERPVAIAFGVTATIRRRGKTVTITIVGEDEADPAAGCIAFTAPLARALEGAEVGDIIEFEAGGNSEDIEVLAVGS